MTQEELVPYYQLVNNVITELGVDPSICFSPDKPGQWELKRGSATIWIDMFIDANNQNKGYFQMMAPICEVPATRREEFLDEVLTIGHNLYGCGFTKYDKWIYVKLIREVDDLSQMEIRATFDRIGYYGDFYDDYFKNKYYGGGSNGDDAGGR